MCSVRFSWLCLFLLISVCHSLTSKQCKEASKIREVFLLDSEQCSPLLKSLDEVPFIPSLLLRTFPVDGITTNYVREVRGSLFSRVSPSPLVTDVRLAAVSRDALSDVIDLDVSATSDPRFVDFINGKRVSPVQEFFAHRYGGHQFGVWADQLGDGRAHYIGEVENSQGERWELQLKGSGLTPYSRRGDGRAVLRSSIREFLACEALHHLGVPTTRALALVVSEDRVLRDPLYDGHVIKEKSGIVLRAAPSFFRIGSFEILHVKKEVSLLQKLLAWHNMSPGQLVASVTNKTAHLVAAWQSFGFAHGVLNTDNWSMLGITLDLGPFRFLDEYDPSVVPNASDDQKRYSYKRQVEAAHFMLRRLAESLHEIATGIDRKQMEQATSSFLVYCQELIMERLCTRLGLASSSDDHLVAKLLRMMEQTEADLTMTFRQLVEATIQELEAPPRVLWGVRTLSSHGDYSSWLKAYLARAKRGPHLLRLNPRYVLRNWIAQQVIEEAERGSFDLLRKVSKILERPFELQQDAEDMGLADPAPMWARQLRVSCSS